MTRTFSNYELQDDGEFSRYDQFDKKWYSTIMTTRDVYRDVDTAADITKRQPGKWRAPTNYNRSIQRGQVLIPVSFSGWEIRYSSTGKLYTAYKGGGYEHNVQLDAALPSYSATFKQVAEVRALSKLKDQKVNLSVAFGERKRTAEMLVDSATRIRKAVRSARRLQFSEALRHLAGVRDRSPVTSGPGGKRRNRRPPLRSANDKEVSNGWLQIQYGWKPLLSDGYGAVEELRRNDERFNDRYTCCVKGSMSSGRVSSYSILPSDFGYNNLRWRAHRHILSRESCFVRLDYVLANPAIASLAQVGITNPLEVAWELVPFSFVVDWFLPIGSYLGSLDAALGWSFKGGSYTRVMKRHWKGKCVFRTLTLPSGTYGVNGHFSSPWAAMYRAKMERTVYASSPIPDLPKLDSDPVRGLRLGNAIALLGQAFR